MLPPPAPRCLVHVVSVGSCWTTEVALKLYILPYPQHFKLEDFHLPNSRSEIHAAVIAQPNTIVLHLLNVDCPYQVVWVRTEVQKFLFSLSKATLLIQATLGLALVGDLSKSSFTASNQPNHKTLHPRATTSEKAYGESKEHDGTKSKAIFPFSQGWHQQLTSAFLCLTRRRQRPTSKKGRNP